MHLNVPLVNQLLVFRAQKEDSEWAFTFGVSCEVWAEESWVRSTLRRTWLLSANIQLNSLLQMGLSFSYILKYVKGNVSHFLRPALKFQKAKRQYKFGKSHGGNKLTSYSKEPTLERSKNGSPFFKNNICINSLQYNIVSPLSFPPSNASHKPPCSLSNYSPFFFF